jgi:hypothetical protein
MLCPRYLAVRGGPRYKVRGAGRRAAGDANCPAPLPPKLTYW